MASTETVARSSVNRLNPVMRKKLEERAKKKAEYEARHQATAEETKQQASAEETKQQAGAEEAKQQAGKEAKAAEETRNKANDRAAASAPEYDAAEVKTGYEKIISRRREEFGDLLAIVYPRSKLDVIAEAALEALKAPDDFEKELREFIVRQGIGSEVKKATARLNARRMTDARRRVLAATYVWLLAKLIDHNREDFRKVVKDDVGVAEKIMLDLEADDGPLDRFASLIVKSVMERNLIKDDERVRKLVAQQVRSAI